MIGPLAPVRRSNAFADPKDGDMEAVFGDIHRAFLSLSSRCPRSRSEIATSIC